MFLLPSLAFGLVFATLLGGRVERLLEVRLRHTWLVFAALAIQLALFSRLGHGVGGSARQGLHLASYVLLLACAAANVRLRPLLVVSIGLVLNATVILANGGTMPVSLGAAAAAGIGDTTGTNVVIGHGRLQFLGDVFALPRALPLTNVFSIGDIFLGVGMVVFIVVVSLRGEAPMEPRLSRMLAPLRVPAYRRLAAGKLISHAGDWLTMATLIGWTYGRTGSIGAVTLLMVVVRLAPPIVGGGVAAVIVDRLPKERLLVWVELLRGVAVSIALAGVVTHRMWIVLGALALSGAVAATSRAAVPALVPSLLPREQLASANASLGVAEDAAMATGALLAGVTLSWVGTAPALAADLVTFVLAAMLFSTIRVPLRLPRRSHGPRAESGFGYVAGRMRLLLLVASFAAATLATGLVSVTLPRFLETDLGLGTGAWGFGFGALSLGLAAGQGAVGFLSVGERASRWIGLGLAMLAATFFMLALTVHVPTALLLLGLAGFVDGTTDVVFKTVVQREADPRYYGAVFGFAGASMRTTMIAGVLAAPLANRFLAPTHVIMAASVVLVGAAGIALASAAARRTRLRGAVAPV